MQRFMCMRSTYEFLGKLNLILCSRSLPKFTWLAESENYIFVHVTSVNTQAHFFRKNDRLSTNNITSVPHARLSLTPNNIWYSALTNHYKLAVYLLLEIPIFFAKRLLKYFC